VKGNIGLYSLTEGNPENKYNFFLFCSEKVEKGGDRSRAFMQIQEENLSSFVYAFVHFTPFNLMS
jgi:hypothetical protein